MRAPTHSLRQAFTKSNGNVRELLLALTQTDAFLYRPRRAAIKGDIGDDYFEESNYPKDDAAWCGGSRDRPYRFLEAMLWPGHDPRRRNDPPAPGRLLLTGRHAARQWRPTGTETNFTLSEHDVAAQSLQGSAAVRRRARPEDHRNRRGSSRTAAAWPALLTGTKLLPGTFETGMGLAGFADGPSVDQVIATRNSMGLKFPSLEFSSGWSISGRSAGEVSFAADQITYAASKKPIAPQINTIAAFKRVFGDAAYHDHAGRARTPKSSRFWMQCWSSTPLSRRS